ncbi:MBL fold metallo-hydrolase [Verrucomicrobiota bacterium]
MPAFGEAYRVYGGNTSCFTVNTDTGNIIFDAGTGISFAAETLSNQPQPLPITMLFTHFHMDHLIGLPSFAPLYNKKANIQIMADPERDDDWKKTLKTIVGKPYWPVGLAETDAAMNLVDLPADKCSLNLYGIEISWFRVPHPQGCIAYRVNMPGKDIVIATDVEYREDDIDPAFINFCATADCLIFDAQYTPKEYLSHSGWGHSTWKVAVRAAIEAKVQKLVLTHHEPVRKDKDIESIVEDARKLFPETHAATENMLLHSSK